jgi:uncharacterized SAM-binding protein YcdF (DUF218 family)
VKKKIKYLLILIAAMAGSAIFLFTFTNIYLLLLKPLDIGIEVDTQYGDVILVLGGGLKKGRELGYSTEERLNLAVELFRQKKKTIIVSGGSLYKGSPAIKKITAFFLKNRIEEKYIKFEGRSQTTFDNFYYANKMIDDMKFKEIVVSTSPYHQRRSRMILSYLGFTNFKIAKMRASEIYQAKTVKQRLRNLKLIFREYLAILKFKLFKR